jgi:uncharacterized membrane protein
MRTLAKTTTYGLMHIIIAFFVALFVSRDLHVALAISMLEPFVQIVFFSIHEYFWNKSHPGVPSPHQGCCGSGVDFSKVVAFFKP